MKPAVKRQQMLITYSEYIDSYLSRFALSKRPFPGEHHFVSAYLVPRLFELNQRVPDYINPDGTKGIIGDVVYYKEHRHQFGIEAKLGTIRLTKGEFNEWIVNTDTARQPHTFIGISTDGIGLCSWTEFRTAYIAAVAENNRGWIPSLLSRGYGPMKSVNTLLPKLPEGKFFRKGKNPRESAELEASFIDALKKEIAC
jgi:hypothetical protein